MQSLNILRKSSQGRATATSATSLFRPESLHCPKGGRINESLLYSIYPPCFSYTVSVCHLYPCTQFILAPRFSYTVSVCMSSVPLHSIYPPCFSYTVSVCRLYPCTQFILAPRFSYTVESVVCTPALNLSSSFLLYS